MELLSTTELKLIRALLSAFNQEKEVVETIGGTDDVGRAFVVGIKLANLNILRTLLRENLLTQEQYDGLVEAAEAAI